MSSSPEWCYEARCGKYAEIEQTMLAATDRGEGYFPDCEVRGACYESWADTIDVRDGRIEKYRESLNYWQMFASCVTSGGEGTARMAHVYRVEKKLECINADR